MILRNRPLIKYGAEVLEKEVELIEGGATYREVSEALNIPISTVCLHINNRMRYHHPELFKRVVEAYKTREQTGNKFKGYYVEENRNVNRD